MTEKSTQGKTSLKKLNITTIRIDGGTQPRTSINYEVVKNYAELMREDVKFPPVAVFYDGAEYWLADGFHRYHATKSNATTTIEAEVHTGSLDDAQLYAWGANKGRGLDMSPDDNREIIRKMLLHPKWSLWSQAEIAKHVGVSAMTVSRVKKSMEDLPKTDTKKFVRDGKEHTMNTTNLGKKAESKPTTKPDVTTYDERDEKIQELIETVQALSDENELLKDKIAIGQWDASEIEKIDAEDTIKELRERIRILEIDNKALRDSRDMFQSRNAELMAKVKSLQKRLKETA